MPPGSNQDLGQQISQICLSVFLSNPQNSTSSSLPYCMIIDSIVLLRQGRFRDASILDHPTVITEHIRRSLNPDTKTPQLVSQSNQQILTNPQCHQLTAKSGTLYSVLPLAVSDNGSILHKDQDPSVGPPGHHISSMIRIHKGRSDNRQSQRFRHVRWHLFLNITIEIPPICSIVKGRFINERCTWVKANPTQVCILQVSLQVCKHMIESLQMTNPGRHPQGGPVPGSVCTR
jgi:hypothetical protein